MDENEALGRAIRVLRAERGMSRRELAEGAGVSYPFLSEIENGKKRPSTRTLGAIADALGVRPHELLAEAEARTEPASERRSWFEGDAMHLESSDASIAAARSAPERYSRRPSIPRSPSSALRELAELIEHLAPEDVERVLDFARRLTR